jgi:hypothetical protein
MKTGRYNVGLGLLALGGFLLMGFLLVWLRDFAPDHEAWAASYGTGVHFETRLAHVHGTLFAFLNVVIGFVLARVQGFDRARAVAAALSLTGLLMPSGILAEILFHAPPAFVLLGGLAMGAGVFLTGALALRGWTPATA